jgi:hypothetical protein
LTAHLRSGENSWAWSIPDIAGLINEESAGTDISWLNRLKLNFSSNFLGRKMAGPMAAELNTLLRVEDGASVVV